MREEELLSVKPCSMQLKALHRNSPIFRRRILPRVMRDPILTRDKNHTRRTPLARRARIVSRPTVDVYTVLSTVVRLDGFADAVDAVRVEGDCGAVERFHPIHLAALFTFGGGDTSCGLFDVGAEGGEGVGGGMADVEGEEDVTGAGVDAARGEAEDSLR